MFGTDNVVAITDPVYPVYVDTNVMAGRTGPAEKMGRYAGLVYLPVTAENDFVPALPATRVDLIYLCYPNNPTGTVASRETLAQWVDYAKRNRSLILFDAAYEAYISTPGVPHSIYEIPGARDVAIEFRSFSKTAGFTGTRCAFTVVPNTVTAQRADGAAIAVHSLWNRRHSTKFNGVSYIVQRGAEAVYSAQGKEQVRSLIDLYLTNAAPLARGPFAAGAACFWRCRCALRVGEDPGERDQLGLFRPPLEGRPPGGNPRQRLRAGGRRLFPLKRVQFAGQYRRSDQAIAQTARMMPGPPPCGSQLTAPFKASRPGPESLNNRPESRFFPSGVGYDDGRHCGTPRGGVAVDERVSRAGLRRGAKNPYRQGDYFHRPPSRLRHRHHPQPHDLSQALRLVQIDDSLMIRDLGSTNGVRVNGGRSARKPASGPETR